MVHFPIVCLALRNRGTNQPTSFLGPTCRQQCGIDKLHFHCYWIPKTRYILRRKISVVVLIGFQLWHVLSGLLGIFDIWCLSIVTPCCDRQMCSPIPMFQPVPTMCQPLPTVKFPSISEKHTYNILTCMSFKRLQLWLVLGILDSWSGTPHWWRIRVDPDVSPECSQNGRDARRLSDGETG